MATVLLTGGGGTGGIAAIESLQNHTDHEVVTVDMNPESVGFYFADSGRIVPPAASDKWPDAMAEVIAEFDVDVVVPLIDEELPRLPALRNRASDDVAFIAPSQSFIDTVLDKWTMVKAFEKQDLTVPETVLATDLDVLTTHDFPRLVKPRLGRGSRDIELTSSKEEVKQYIEDTNYDTSDIILQEYLEGTEFTTSVVVTEEKDLISVVPKEVSKPDGTTMRGVTRDMPQIDTSCRNIFEKLDPKGPFNAQQMVVENEVYTFEINPRFSASSCLTIEAGINEIDLLIRDAMGEPIPDELTYESDLHMFRYLDQVYVSQEELFKESEEST